MHSYLRSIGFSDIKNRRQLTPITKEIIANPTTKNIVTVDADTRVQNHNIYKNTMKTLVQNLLTNYKQRDNITAQSKRLREYCASGEK